MTLQLFAGLQSFFKAEKNLDPYFRLTFVLLIVILVVKPTGLFGEKATDKV